MGTVVQAELAEELRRLAMWERLHEARLRLREIGPVSELVQRSTAVAAGATGLDRVVLSRFDGNRLVAESVHVRDDPDAAAAALARLRQEPVEIGYPLLEGEMLRRRRGTLVVPTPGAQPARTAHGATMQWRSFVAAPIALEGRVIGFFHGDRPSSGEPLGDLDKTSLELFAEGFAQALECTVLRRRLRIQQQEIRRIASWADARTSELGDRPISLVPALEPEEVVAGGTQGRGDGGVQMLTKRELEVLQQMAEGRTNAEIAHDLFISDGTVKFHVKNVLRKLQAANRSEATAKYLHLRLRRGA